MQKFLIAAAVIGGIAWTGLSATVHVYLQDETSGVVTQLGDKTVEAGTWQESDAAPEKSGYIFTYWSISSGNELEARDGFGRANNHVRYVAYDTATLTAHYLPIDQDEDADGVADGYELYWYGTLDYNASSDTDHDGFDFAAELAAGTSPLMPDFTIEGGVLHENGDKVLYNPKHLDPYIIRSDPEGVLCETTTNYVNLGEMVRLPSFDHTASSFAYWTINGVRQKDALGRSEDEISFTMPNHLVECVVKCESDVLAREKMYWYGTSEIADDSDTDQDGFTFVQEIAAGTNPLLFDYTIDGGVLKSETELTQYNAKLQSPYVVRSNPEGDLISTTTNYVIVGTTITLPALDDDRFAYWEIDGVPQRDVFGRALDSLSFRMPNHFVDCVAVAIADADERAKLYWYGRTDISLDSDTDGDGYSFAQEIAAGTNPHLYDYSLDGGMLAARSDMRELDLQRYEQVVGTLVDDQYAELFISSLSGNGATSRTFASGSQIWPVVADVNGDGLWDLIVCSETTTNLLVNVGTKGNPQFREVTTERMSEGWIWPDLQMNSLAKLETMSLDVNPTAALSATTNGASLLVSDTAGRIWYYLSNNPNNSNNSYTLQHKVWGGSHAGFANGLMLAAVDWEDDGDLDCLCGTADGKLMLLRDPKVGRPTNLTALSGIGNILLTWDPNAQSRVRGYKVYRKDGDDESAAWGQAALPVLPTYRDFFDLNILNSNIQAFSYKVSSLSRFYVAGNSTPIESESIATDPVRAVLGTVKFFWTDVNCRVGDKVQVMLSIENALNCNVADMSQTITYDPEYLTPVKVSKTGLTENLTIEEHAANGQWVVSFTGAVGGGTPVLPAGGGKFLTFVFDARKAGTTQVGGGVVDPALPGATVTIEAGAATEVPRYSPGDANGDGRIDVEDLRELARLKDALGRKPTPDQIRAGDLNGNGRLDDADYQALRALLKEKGIL